MHTNIRYAIVSLIADYGTDVIEFTVKGGNVLIARFFDGQLVKEATVPVDRARAIYRKALHRSYVPVA